MKVLKSGNSGKPRKLTGICRCGCQVQTDDKEAFLDTIDPRENPAYRVTCPECKDLYLWVK